MVFKKHNFLTAYNDIDGKAFLQKKLEFELMVSHPFWRLVDIGNMICI